MEVQTINAATKLSDCTLGDLLAFLRNNIDTETAKNQTTGRKRNKAKTNTHKIIIDGVEYYKGIAGIQEIFGIGRSKAIEYRKSEWIKDAIQQESRIILTNKELAISLFCKRFNKSQR